LVGSARHVFVWAMAVRHFSHTPAHAKNMHHALAFLRDVHRNAETGGYAWQRD
jgi:mannose/cellobiose epimerase-like protein (N-acyl-D-glucosamine 2-epimerase family)